jgi:hypothetical protein
MNSFGYSDPEANAIRRLKRRVRDLPAQIVVARNRYFNMVKEAEDLRMLDLLEAGELEFVKGRDA